MKSLIFSKSIKGRNLQRWIHWMELQFVEEIMIWNISVTISHESVPLNYKFFPIDLV